MRCSPCVRVGPSYIGGPSRRARRANRALPNWAEKMQNPVSPSIIHVSSGMQRRKNSWFAAELSSTGRTTRQPRSCRRSRSWRQFLLQEEILRQFWEISFALVRFYQPRPDESSSLCLHLFVIEYSPMLSLGLTKKDEWTSAY